jgi:hypothetical protein
MVSWRGQISALATIDFHHLSAVSAPVDFLDAKRQSGVA